MSFGGSAVRGFGGAVLVRGFWGTLLLIAAAGCGPQGDRFVTANARVHVNMLAETIGSRPAGSDANRRAREYLVDQLEIAGLQVRVQEVDARRPDLGLAGRVSNIVGIRQGQLSEAIAIVALRFGARRAGRGR